MLWYLVNDAAWACLAAARRADLCQWLGVAAAFTDDWMAALRVCAAWRGPGAAGGAGAAAAVVASAGASDPSAAPQWGSRGPAAPAAQLEEVQPAAAGGVSYGGAAGGGQINVPLPSAKVSAMEGTEKPWWMEADAGAAPAGRQAYTGSTQTNILLPNHLGDSTIFGSSVFEELAAGNNDAMSRG